MYMRGGVCDILMIDSMGKKKTGFILIMPLSERISCVASPLQYDGGGGVSVCLHPASVCEVAWALRLRTVMVFFFSKLLS